MWIWKQGVPTETRSPALWKAIHQKHQLIKNGERLAKRLSSLSANGRIWLLLAEERNGFQQQLRERRATRGTEAECGYKPTTPKEEENVWLAGESGQCSKYGNVSRKRKQLSEDVVVSEKQKSAKADQGSRGYMAQDIVEDTYSGQ
ncbi:hypothetical protein NDU88_001694 [Pleurodeles waltl]|uniref:Uncharacterized protein n=1 Tax=Pleurodeles waltl TaxID=8319 RepID=A0AAV7LC28_PLEWA|nr:hypothetical protein NDU88_001694 [Pleurodeles waltl]